jgi:coproporphyrinogen III oxidase
MMSMGPKQVRDVFVRRIDYLTNRMRTRGEEAVSYDKRERQALQESLPLVEGAMMPKGDGIVSRRRDDGTVQIMFVRDGQKVGYATMVDRGGVFTLLAGGDVVVVPVRAEELEQTA